ncbi:DNA polymerase III subunit delta' [Altererythrobacter sp. KTW20L]|uniref:DNA polymerase III subunit delta' n=1 Tax=Altererythrobacter sp. KTW20L TaxID=2942210 RepID=UPI0020BDBEA6|nr:DNA polymerase III subunit delta' [Altererythrobacter sp. KTW20L]MCL6251081.1 DNA polymerase III subunit delta' [Altererythrobacter sp. KTW20L]
MMLDGHQDAWAQWHAAMAGPRMHHGWILAGQRGIGKASFAMAAARELVAEPGVPQPPGEHPDVIVLSHLPASKDDEKKRDDGKPFALKRSISVDQIRAMQLRLHTRPTLGARRVIIIDPADDLEKGAANALLKSLEEPPVGTHFMLVAHRPGRLLATIRSRCRLLRFARIEDGAIDAILQREVPSADSATRAAAIMAAGGSPGAALDFVELDLKVLHRLMQDIAVRGDPGFILRGRLAEAMGARPDRRKQMAAVELARAIAAGALQDISAASIPGVVETHAELARLTAEVPTANFDAGLLVLEIGTLLTRLAASREPAHG